MNTFLSPSGDSNLPEALRSPELFRQYAIRVYRFHLARRGDVQEAQLLTRETYRRVIGRSPKQADTTLASLMAAARYLQAFTHPYTRADPPDIPKTRSSSFLPRMDEGVAVRGEMALVAAALRGLPSLQADALALRIFAGLNFEEIREALGQPEGKTILLVDSALRALVLRLTPDAADAANPQAIAASLQALAAEVQPSESLLGALEQEFLTPPAYKSILDRLMGHPRAWQQAYRLRAGVSWGERHLMVLLMAVCAFAIAFYLLPHPAIPPGNGQVVTTVSTPAPTSTGSPANSVASGWLVPPSPSVCLDWQKRVADLTNRQPLLTSNFLVTLPGQTASAGQGLSCQIELLAGKYTLSQVDVQLLLGALDKDGYAQDPASSASSVKGGLLLHGGQGFALIVANPIPGMSAPCASLLNVPCPAPGSAFSSIRLVLANDTVRYLAEDFFHSWSAGDVHVLSDLSSALRSRLPQVASLDDQIGFQRTPIQSLQFSWYLVENAGDWILVNAHVQAAGRFSLPSKDLGDVYIAFAGQGGVWSVQAISRQEIFHPTQDQALVANPDGSLALLSVASGDLRQISGAGVYPLKPGEPRPLLSLSPDGNWLIVSTSDVSRLISLSKNFTRSLGPQLTAVAWSPDGQRIAYALSNDPQQLLTMSLGGGMRRPLARLQGPLAELAWSPDGRSLGVVFTAYRSSDPVEIDRVTAVVDATDGSVDVLLSYPALAQGAGQSSGLKWTSDGSQLWDINQRLAIHVRDGSVNPLVTAGISSNVSFSQPALIVPNPGQGQPSVVSAYSPDGSLRASAYINYTGYSDALATNSTNGDGRSLWVDYLGPIAALGWTGEGGNLIAAENVDSPGRIWKVDPFTGRYVQLAGDVAFLGMQSDLQGDSRSLVQPAITQTLTAPGPLESWSEYHSRSLGLTLKVPAGWLTLEQGAGANRRLVISSVNFSRLDEMASIDQDVLFTELDEIRLPRSMSPQAVLQDILARDRILGILWEPVTINGHPGYRLDNSDGRSSRVEYLLIHSGSLLWIAKSPGSSQYDAAFQQILDSLQFTGQAFSLFSAPVH